MATKIEECNVTLRKNFPDEDPWITTQDACDILGVSEFAIRDWRREHRLPATRFGVRFKYRKSHVEQILALRKIWGTDWSTHTDWAVKVEAPAAEGENVVEDTKIEFASKLLERARELDQSGDKAGCCALVWAAIDFGGLLED
jgi:excisionase family DNA binding protein